MSTQCSTQHGRGKPPHADDIARELGPVFAERAQSATDEDQFVAENFASLKAAGLVEAGVPAELGGGGASVDELAEMLRILALSLRLHRAGLFHAHPSGRDSGLALEGAEGGRRSNRCSSASRPSASSCCPAAARTGSPAPARPRRSTAAIASRHSSFSPPASRR